MSPAWWQVLTVPVDTPSSVAVSARASGRYFALASEQLRQCCLPLDQFACTREGLR